VENNAGAKLEHGDAPVRRLPRTDVFVERSHSNHDDYVCRACAGRFDADEVTP